MSTYTMTDTQRDLWISNNGKWSLDFEANSGGDMMYHVHTIHAIARGINAKTIVDLGVRNGQATRALLLSAKENNGRVFSVDTDDCNHACPAEYKNNWLFYQMTTDQFYNDVVSPKNTEIDLLMIDSDHSYEQSKIDFENYSKHVRVNGIVLLHDVYPAKECRKVWPGGPGGVWKTFQEVDGQLWDKLILPYCSGLGVLRKKASTIENIPNGYFYGNDIDSTRYGGTHTGILDKTNFEEWNNSKIIPFDK